MSKQNRRSKRRPVEDIEIPKKAGIKISFNCNGSNIGNGVGIGNGNLNGGGGGGCCGGNNGQSGNTGSTGETGPNVCPNACNLVCEQVYLEQTTDTFSVSKIGQPVVFTFKSTNISGADINSPLVITSSLFGTFFLTEEGLKSGQTLTTVHRYFAKREDFEAGSITSAAFVSLGVSTGIPGQFTPGVRVSPVVTAFVQVVLPNLDVSAVLTVGTHNDLKLTFKNIGTLDIVNISANLEQIFAGCTPTLVNPIGNPFTLGNKTLNFTGTLAPGGSLSVEVIGSKCRSLDQYKLLYEFSSAQSIPIFRSEILVPLPHPTLQLKEETQQPEIL